MVWNISVWASRCELKWWVGIIVWNFSPMSCPTKTKCWYELWFLNVVQLCHIKCLISYLDPGIFCLVYSSGLFSIFGFVLVLHSFCPSYVSKKKSYHRLSHLHVYGVILISFCTNTQLWWIGFFSLRLVVDNCAKVVVLTLMDFQPP